MNKRYLADDNHLMVIKYFHFSLTLPLFIICDCCCIGQKTNRKFSLFSLLDVKKYGFSSFGVGPQLVCIWFWHEVDLFSKFLMLFRAHGDNSQQFMFYVCILYCVISYAIQLKRLRYWRCQPWSVGLQSYALLMAAHELLICISKSNWCVRSYWNFWKCII